MRRLQGVCWLLVALLVPFAANTSSAEVAVDVLGDGLVRAGEFEVAINKSQVLKIDQPFNELLIGNPEIADVLALSNDSIYVLGKKLGTTNLTIYGAGKRLIAVVDLVVSYDVESLKSKLHDVLPGEAIEVRPVNGGILLSGKVTNPIAVSNAAAIAEQFAPKAVTNALTVQGSQQVMLQVKFAEVSRNVVRQLGIGHDLAVAGDVGFSLITSSALPLATGVPFGTGVVSASPGNVDLETTFETLEQRGLVRTLAEPNLIALSGDTANFLAGGEFPIPVDQDDDTISIEFKEFGVGLSFTPTVIGTDLINLVVAPEVSQIDPTVSIQVDEDGIEIPGLSTRRAKTTIELRDGQSFAIAGLLQENYQNAISGLPWLADIPILGLLFRSTGFQRNETELVILVTPRLVKPAASMAELAAPTDRLVLPSDADLFLFARPEAPESGRSTPSPGPGPQGRTWRGRRAERGAGRPQRHLRLHHRVRSKHADQTRGPASAYMFMGGSSLWLGAWVDARRAARDTPGTGRTWGEQKVDAVVLDGKTPVGKLIRGYENHRDGIDRFATGGLYGGGLILFGAMGMGQTVKNLLEDEPKQGVDAPTSPPTQPSQQPDDPTTPEPPDKPDQPDQPDEPEPTKPPFVIVQQWRPDGSPADNSTLWHVAGNNLKTLLTPQQMDQVDRGDFSLQDDRDTLVADWAMPRPVALNPQYPLGENPDLIQPGWRLRVG